MVLMKCLTPCLMCGVEKLGLDMSRKLVRSLSYSFPGWDARASTSQSEEEKYLSASTSHFPLRCTMSELARKESAPNRGRDTSAMTKPQLYCFIANLV